MGNRFLPGSSGQPTQSQRLFLDKERQTSYRLDMDKYYPPAYLRAWAGTRGVSEHFSEKEIEKLKAEFVVYMCSALQKMTAIRRAPHGAKVIVGKRSVINLVFYGIPQAEGDKRIMLRLDAEVLKPVVNFSHTIAEKAAGPVGGDVRAFALELSLFPFLLCVPDKVKPQQFRELFERFSAAKMQNAFEDIKAAFLFAAARGLGMCGTCSYNTMWMTFSNHDKGWWRALLSRYNMSGAHELHEMGMKPQDMVEYFSLGRRARPYAAFLKMLGDNGVELSDFGACGKIEKLMKKRFVFGEPQVRKRDIVEIAKAGIREPGKILECCGLLKAGFAPQSAAAVIKAKLSIAAVACFFPFTRFPEHLKEIYKHLNQNARKEYILELLEMGYFPGQPEFEFCVKLEKAFGGKFPVDSALKMYNSVDGDMGAAVWAIQEGRKRTAAAALPEPEEVYKKAFYLKHGIGEVEEAFIKKVAETAGSGERSVFVALYNDANGKGLSAEQERLVRAAQETHWLFDRVREKLKKREEAEPMERTLEVRREARPEKEAEAVARKPLVSSGDVPRNLSFGEVVEILGKLGFEKRPTQPKSDHVIFRAVDGPWAGRIVTVAYKNKRYFVPHAYLGHNLRNVGVTKEQWSRALVRVRG